MAKCPNRSYIQNPRKATGKSGPQDRIALLLAEKRDGVTEYPENTEMHEGKRNSPCVA